MFTRQTIEDLVLSLTGSPADYISAGHDNMERNRVYLLPAQQLILKVYGTYARWGREVKSLTFLSERDTPVPVPAMIDHGIFQREVPWVLMTRLPGDTLSDVEHAMAPHERNLLTAEIAQCHAEFHNMCAIDFFGDWVSGVPKPEGQLSYSEYTCIRNRYKADLVLSKQYPEHSLFGLARQCLVRLEGTLNHNVHFALCHNDFNERNIFVQHKQGRWNVAGLIDFESAYPSDSESDLARVLFDVYEQEEMETYLNSYSQCRELSPHFHEKLVYYLIALCLDICSWSYLEANNYYKRAVSLLERLIRK